MPRRRKLNQFFLGSGRLFDERKDKLTDKELESMTITAEHLGVSTEPEGLAERIGEERVGNKNLDEKIKQVQRLRDGWIMKKTKKGNIFISIGEVKPVIVKNKKTGDYKYGRIEITVDPEWIGYTAMVVLSKTKIPKMKIYKEGEVTLKDLRDEDPSYYADIVFEDKKEESESSNTTVSDRLIEYGRKRKELEESKKSKKIVVPKKRLYEDEDDERNDPNYDW